MGREINRLSHPAWKNVTRPGRYNDGQGLYLLVDKGGHQRWVFRFGLHGRSRDMGLGSGADVKLSEARKLADDARELLRKGIDPINARGRPEGVPTFGQVADDLIESIKGGWRGRSTEANWKRSFNSHGKALREIPVDAVTVDMVLAVLRPMWMTKPESAGKLRERIERALDAAKAKGYRTGDNPARWRGNLAHLLPPRPKLIKGHHRAIPYSEIPAFMARLREIPTTGAAALEWTILTAARESMTTGAVWGEIDGDLWTIPANRMKESLHRVPLSPASLAVLKRVRPKKPKAREYIFEGAREGTCLSNATMDALLDRMGVNATPHGFRSTFRDWAGDCTEFPREVAEAALAHVVGDDVERAYRRGDALEKRRKLMDAWADYCATPPTADQSGVPRSPAGSASDIQS